jgi:hypothetical protein
VNGYLSLIEGATAGEIGFDEAVDLIEGILDLLGECAGELAVTAAAESAGGDDRVAEFVFEGANGLDVIEDRLGELGGLFGVFAGEDAGFGGQAVGETGLGGLLTTFRGRRAATLAAIGT